MTTLRLLVIVIAVESISTASAQELQVFFGLMHGHTGFSDGTGEPDQAFEMAKDAGLDFFALTEHNHNEAAGDDGIFLTPQLYAQLIKTARAHSQADEFLAIWGQEVSTISAGNHAQIFFADQICDMEKGDFKYLYEDFLPKHPEIPFIQFNHPDVRKDQRASTSPKERNNDYGIDDYDGDFAQLLAAAGPHVALIELIVGPAKGDSVDKLHQDGRHEHDYRFYLNQGFRLSPSVGQDNHLENWGLSTHARMGVWAEELTAGAFVDAIRARRTYATEDENARVMFTANGSVMGSAIEMNGTDPVRLQIAVEDEDEPDARYRVRLFYDDAIGGNLAAVIEDQSFDGNGSVEFLHAPRRGAYYFAKLTQEGDDHDDDIWTAPVWVGSPAIALRALASNTDDPEKKEIHWDEAHDYVGREVTVNGTVIRSFNFENKAVFFNFDRNYQETLTLILLRSDFGRFGGEEAIGELQQRLTNKSVRVSGSISLYQNQRLQLRLTDPSQILDVRASPEQPEE
jgi:hypothetical protein